MESKEISATVRRLFPTVGDLFAMLGIVLGVQVVVGLLLSVVAGFGGFDMQNAAPEAVGRYMCLLYLYDHEPRPARCDTLSASEAGRGNCSRFRWRG